MLDNNKALREAVNILPEIYQPIYGHADLYPEHSRLCEDRLVYIKKIYKSLETRLGRPLRVLDLGCAQGFISLSIASWGAEVFGLDFLDKNVAVCKLLAIENPSLRVSFSCGKIEELIPKLKENEFDLILGLSVFHHLCNQYGWEKIQKLLELLATKTKAAIFELALSEEPLYWGPSLPKDYRNLLTGFACVRKIAEFPTHLSELKRPLCYASNQYIYFRDNSLIKIDKSFNLPHNMAGDTHLGTRKYFIGEGKFIKFVVLHSIEHSYRDEYNKNEITSEANFLRKMDGNDIFPTLIKYEIDDDEGWVVRNSYEGKILSDVISQGQEYDGWNVIKQVLDILALLEKDGYYCTDLRTWNLLYTSDNRIKFIDFGSMQKKPIDCQWPSNVVLSFLIFMNEVLSKKIRVLPLRYVSLASTLQTWVSATKYFAIWHMTVEQGVFEKLNEVLFNENYQMPSAKINSITVGDCALIAMEDIANCLIEQIKELQNETFEHIKQTDLSSKNFQKQMESNNANIQKQIDFNNANIQNQLKNYDSNMSRQMADKMNVLATEYKSGETAIAQRIQTLEQEIFEIKNSKLWKIYKAFSKKNH